MPAGVAAVLKAVLGVLGISKRVKKAAKWIPLQLHILLRVKVLGKREVSKEGVIQGQSYININNIYIINLVT